MGQIIEFTTVEESVPSRFLRVAAELPRQLAVNDGGTSWTYAELADRIAAIAAAVSRCAIPHDHPVIAILMPTDALHIAAVLGTMQAGSIYTSLDPVYPDSRLQAMIAACEAGLILTTTEFAAKARALGAHAVLCVDEFDETVVDAPAHTSRSPTPLTFACIYFTSGSTGVPKAVVHTHRNILFDIRRQTRDMGITAGDRFDLLFSASFSAFLSPVFGALLTGASVHPFSLKAHHMEAVRDWLRVRAITISTMSVSSYRALVSTLAPSHAFPAMRAISIGAEPVTVNDLTLFRRHFPPHCSMQNALATTETRTIAQVYYPATGPMPGEMSVGFPVEGKSMTLRDAEDRSVAQGEIGEIVIESEFISPGPWQDLRMLPGFALPGPRVITHHTGDLARALPDGQIVHLGRVDTQVKIRGHRIEILEIEDRLLADPSVANAAVFAAQSEPGRDLLLGLLVARPGFSCDPMALRAKLNASLPDYMVPNRLVLVPSLPTTPTGKLARRELAACLAAHDAQHPTAKENPDTQLLPFEKELLALWRETLQTPRANIDGDFFALGGDSLRAVQLFASIEKQFNLAAPVSLLLRAATARQLAALLLDRKTPAPMVDRVLIRAGGPRTPLYLIAPWGNSGVILREIGGDTTLPGDLWALEGGCATTLGEPPASIESMASLIVQRMLEFHPTGQFGIGGYSNGGLIAWETAQQLAALGRTPTRVVLLDCPRLYAARTPNEESWVRHARTTAGIVQRCFDHLIRKHPLGRSAAAWQILETVRDKITWLAWRKWLRTQIEPWTDAFDRNAEISSRYAVRPYAGRVTLIRARNKDDWATRFEHDLGWSPCCTGAFNIVHIPGSHTSILTGRHAAGLQRALRSCFER